MIYIFGDSHGRFNFANLSIQHNNLSQNAITMHRIGRDNQIINFHSSLNDSENIFILCYGEIDCRTHIGKQILIGRSLDEICESLVSSYFQTIRNNIVKFKHIIICSITPTFQRKFEDEYVLIYGQVTHDYPIIGSDSERAHYTKKMNTLLKQECDKHQFIFLDVYDYYARENDTLKYELSDGICHIVKNQYILDQLITII